MVLRGMRPEQEINEPWEPCIRHDEHCTFPEKLMLAALPPELPQDRDWSVR